MSHKIAIVGGGIAGISCGLALMQRGFQVSIYEKAPEFKEIGAVLGVLPNGMDVIESFGLSNQLLEKGGVFHDFRVYLHDGSLLRKSNINYALPALVVRRSDLLKALLSKIHPSVLYPNHRLIDYKQTANNGVELFFENGKKIEADILIGADGIHSVVRKTMIQDSGPVYRGYNLWRGVGKLDDVPDYAGEVWGPGKRFGLYPLPDNYIGWWAALEEEKDCSDLPEGSKEKLMHHFSKWQHPIPALINATEHIIKNDISDRKPFKKWFEGQVVMIGDAAHCTTPNLGQGANMAMESALILSRCLKQYGVNSTAFKKYQEIQFDRTRQINRQSLLLGKMSQLRNPLACALRNAILRAMPLSLAQKTYDNHFGYRASTVLID